MATYTPSSVLRFVFASLGLDQPERAVIFAPIASDGTGTVNTPAPINSVADAIAYFGTSDGVAAARRWFSLGLQSVMELWAFGLDDTGWTANTWTIDAAGTATESGTNVVRLGDAVVNVSIDDEDTATDAAAAFVAAINASTAPFTAAVNGVDDTIADITSVYVGEHITRVRVSVDLYSDRGEPGVAGLSYVVTNNADATGTPASITTTNLTDRDYHWYLHPFVTTAWLDSLQTWITSRWDTANNYAWALSSFNGTQAAVVALTGARNDTYQGYVHARNAPEYELQTSVSLIRTIFDEIAERGRGIGGQRRQVLMNAPTDAEPSDPETVGTSGCTVLSVNRSTTTAIRIVNNRREDSETNEDLRFFDIGAVLRTRELGERLVDVVAAHLGDNITQDGQQLSPSVAAFSVSASQLQGELTAALVQAVKDALLDATEETARDVIQSITLLEAGGIKTGFETVLNPRIVQVATNLPILAALQ